MALDWTQSGGRRDDKYLLPLLATSATSNLSTLPSQLKLMRQEEIPSVLAVALFCSSIEMESNLSIGIQQSTGQRVTVMMMMTHR